MNKTKILITLSIFLILGTTIFAQVEKTVKETKVKVEKVVDNAAKANDMVKDAKESKKCGADYKKACCSAEAKEMKAEIKTHGADCKCDGCVSATASMGKGEKIIKKAHSKDCDCEGCKTTSAAIHDGQKMMKKAHASECDCEGCKVAHAEMKDHKDKNHPKDCSCAACSKS